MARIQLHIGYPKTGTTSLQRFFTDNSDALRERGWLYPSTGRLNNAHYGINFSLKIGSYDGEIEDAATLKNKLNDEISQSRCENVLVSSEYLVTARPITPVKDFFSGHDVSVIVYLRRHDHAFESSYGQAIRTTPSPPWGPNIESHLLYIEGIGTTPFNYLAVLRAWHAEFGTIIVRPFETQQNQPDLYTDFLSAIGVGDCSAFAIPQKRDLVGVRSRRFAAWIDAVQRSPIDKMRKRSLVGALSELAIHDKTDAQPLLSPALRNSIVTRYRASYARIAQEFVGRKMLFEEAELSPSEPWTPPMTPTMQETVDAILRADQLLSRKA